jgi:acyl carrier protein
MSNSVIAVNDERLAEVLQEVFLLDEGQYQDDLGPDQLAGWDSLATIALAVALEDTFGVQPTPDELDAIATIGDIKAYLRSRDIQV